mmetsp:Transcript_13839/g.26387  ORF Transcript_13839/g.26387 Transcript_13839/m.26387 type:complete len:218 (-) Transcript_13839:2154-2807(-)
MKRPVTLLSCLRKLRYKDRMLQTATRKGMLTPLSATNPFCCFGMSTISKEGWLCFKMGLRLTSVSFSSAGDGHRTSPPATFLEPSTCAAAPRSTFNTNWMSCSVCTADPHTRRAGMALTSREGRKPILGRLLKQHTPTPCVCAMREMSSRLAAASFTSSTPSTSTHIIGDTSEPLTRRFGILAMPDRSISVAARRVFSRASPVLRSAAIAADTAVAR